MPEQDKLQVWVWAARVREKTIEHTVWAARVRQNTIKLDVWATRMCPTHDKKLEVEQVV